MGIAQGREAISYQMVKYSYMTDILHRLKCYGFHNGLWLLLVALCFLLQLVPAEAVYFERQGIAQGELWRLLSGHFVHLNWSHFGLNMAGLFMVWLFFRRYQRQVDWLLAIVLIALLCSAGLYADGQLASYVGFSGVLHGLFVLGALYERKRYPLSGLVLLGLLLGKLLWEQWQGALPGSEALSGGRVAVNAHLYGALAGLLYYLLKNQQQKHRKTRTTN
jgi:rhomboid family GlyGly-CTERM serine protease